MVLYELNWQVAVGRAAGVSAVTRDHTITHLFILTALSRSTKRSFIHRHAETNSHRQAQIHTHTHTQQMDGDMDGQRDGQFK